MKPPRIQGLLHLFTSFFLFSFFALPLQAGEISTELRQALESVPPETSLQILVSFRDEPDLRAFSTHPRPENRAGVLRTLHATAERSQNRIRTLLQDRGKFAHHLWIVNAVALEADGDLIQELAELPEVQEIRLDAVLHRAPVVHTQQTFTTGWNLEMINASSLWDQGIRGQRSVVAIIDSGVDGTHPEMQNRWRGGPGDWFNPLAANCTEQTCTPCESQSDFPCDDITGDLVPTLGWLGVGHGTAVAGIAVGAETGVAPEAQWIAAKVFDDEDNALTSHIHAALQWALDPDGDPETDDAPDVVNASWGFDGEVNECIETFRSDVQALKAAGISVIFAAGNFEPEPAPGSTSISPGNYPESFAVGAVDPHRVIAGFSSRGPSACNGSIYPELVAPGVAIETLLPTELEGDPYITISGTSFSAPHVSGALALLRQIHPEASPSRLEELLLGSAVDLGDTGPDNAYGYGLLRLQQSLAHFNAPPPPPTLLFPEDGATGISTSVSLRWEQAPDPDGDPIEHTVLLGQSPDSLTSVAPGATAMPESPALMAAAGLLILIGVGRRFRHRLSLLLLAATLALIFSACSGGDGDNGAPPPPLPATEFMEGVADLQPDTTYYWQVIAQDSYGDTSESPVFSFRTGE